MSGWLVPAGQISDRFALLVGVSTHPSRSACPAHSSAMGPECDASGGFGHLPKTCMHKVRHTHVHAQGGVTHTCMHTRWHHTHVHTESSTGDVPIVAGLACYVCVRVCDPP